MAESRQITENMESESFPEELQNRLSGFDESLSKVEETFQLLHSTPLTVIESKVHSIIAQVALVCDK